VTDAAEPATNTPAGARTFGLRRNVALNIGGKSFSILTSLFSAPFIVYQIGLRAFGFWALISAFSQYAGLLDFGVGSALTRYVAELHALREYEHLARKGAASFYIALGYALVIMLFFVAFCLLIPSSLTHSWPHGWEWAVLGVGVTLSSVSLASTFQAFPGGLARWDLQNIPLIVFQTVFLIAIVLLLSAGDGLGGLGIASAIASVSLVVAAWLTSRRVWRQSLSPQVPTREDFRALFGYGMNLQMANLVLVINVQSDKPVLLAFGGSLKFIAFYELGSRVAFQLRSLPVMALAPLTAAAASETAGRAIGVLRAYYEQTLDRIASFGVAPLFAVFGACSPLVLVWLGTSYTTTAEIVVVLGVGYAFNLVTGAGTAIAQGCGRPELDRNYSLLGLGINVVLTVVLGALVGPWGVIVATSIGLVLSSFWLLRSLDRWVGTRTFSLSGPLRRSGPSVLVGVSCGAATVVAMGFLPTDSRWLCLGYGALSLLVFAALWLLVTPAARSLLPAALRGRRSPPKEIVL
jgi:O-antigen/teichoic acid export membrane protein